jgi:hypothetical protein
MTKPYALRVVKQTGEPADITALNRAEIGPPDRWAKMHIEADRRSPIGWIENRSYKWR